MAKARSRTRSRVSRNTREAWRDTSYPIARTPLPRRHLLPLSLVEDFRRYHPKPHLRTLRSVHASPIYSRSVARLFSRDQSIVRSVSDRRRLRRLSMDIVRTLPRSAVICAKRHSRREVIFALNKAGRGGQRPPRRNSNSQIVCR